MKVVKVVKFVRLVRFVVAGIRVRTAERRRRLATLVLVLVLVLVPMLHQPSYTPLTRSLQLIRSRVSAIPR